jgi:hypothetical protein
MEVSPSHTVLLVGMGQLSINMGSGASALFINKNHAFHLLIRGLGSGMEK